MEHIFSSCEKIPGDATMSSLCPERLPSMSLHLLPSDGTASKSFTSSPWDFPPTSSNIVPSMSNVAKSGSCLSYVELLSSSLRDDISSTELMVDVSIGNEHQGHEDRFSITRESYDVRAHTLPAKLSRDCSAEQECNADNMLRSSKWSNFKKFFLQASYDVRVTNGKKSSTRTSKCSQCGPTTADSSTLTQNNYKREVDNGTNTKGLDLGSKSKTESRTCDEEMCSLGSIKKPAAAEISKGIRNKLKQLSWACLKVGSGVKKTHVDGNLEENRNASIEGMMPNLHPPKSSYNMGLPTKKWYTKGTGFFKKEDPWDYCNFQDNWAYKDVVRPQKDAWRCIGYTKDDHQAE